MIHQATRYMGNPYLVGSSSSPKYGTDCSGLVMQALYAGGISPVPVSAIHHAYPGNEWNSRNLWASKKLKHVAYRHRQRGDLIFYYQPGTHVIWHVAIYLGGQPGHRKLAATDYGAADSQWPTFGRGWRGPRV
jgi:cell wall-associated NlpC family hydrolase